MNLISLRFPLTALLLVTTAGALRWSGRSTPETPAAPLESIDTRLAGWTMERSEPLPDRSVELLRTTSYVNREYRKDGRTLLLYIGYYAQQHAGESMHSPRVCLPANGWEIWQRGSDAIPFQGGRAAINKFAIRNAGQQMLVYYWYQSRRRIVANEYLGRLLLARDALVEGRTSGSIVRIIVPDTPRDSREALQFASALEPQVERCFGR